MSGQIGMTPETGELVQGGVEAEAKQVLTLVHSEIGIYTCLVHFSCVVIHYVSIYVYILCPAYFRLWKTCLRCWKPLDAR